MTARKVYHVTPHNGEWKVKLEGAERANKILEDKTDAVALGKELAKSTGLGQVIIHKADGTVQTEFTYGKDPKQTKG